jgi:MFS family permease
VATQAEKTVVYVAGVVQGIALVTFPAPSTILTGPPEYDLPSTQYGALFLPQVVTAITAALLGARLGGRAGPKRVNLVGLSASLAAMLLLLVSSFLTGEETLSYVLLLPATASLGAATRSRIAW